MEIKSHAGAEASGGIPVNGMAATVNAADHEPLIVNNMNESVSIRNCSAEDADAIVSLGIRTFRDTFDEMNTPENMMLYLNSTFTLRKIKEEITEPGAVFFLAEKHKKAIGYAHMRVSEKPGGLKGGTAIEIQRLYTDKNHIGKRIGYALMNTCLHYAQDHHYDTVWLGVWEHNERALSFYKKWGFERFGEHVFMLGSDAQTDWLLQKQLK
jgi:ribosomal protein S18 acetylase RimI-like enzyme